ncbi:hypothetical protein [Schlesneria paludicola]|uniref:hypothetical protein n=1 Tax=Schlesneria paludicola TaxID=360056 RepID=UPI000299DBF3|nr:hypothetical protein [Schlesneria paludicola]
MNHPRPGEVRELIAKLSDGTLDRDGAVRLNECLTADPIAQAEYLDHLMIDGLLEREFSGTAKLADRLGMQGRSSATTKSLPVAAGLTRFFRSRLGGQALIAAAVTIVAGMTWMAWAPGILGPKQHVELTAQSFKKKTILPADAMLNAVWHGDEAEVVGRFSDVTPFEGSRMLRFVKSTTEPEDGCEIYRIVDLGAVAESLVNHPASIEATAFFNSIQEAMPENDYTFRIAIFSFLDEPFQPSEEGAPQWNNALAFSGTQARADADAKAWQEVTTRLALPAGTKYLVVQLAVVRAGAEDADEDFPGHFVDSLTLNLVSQR